jgi:hypothetical protein
MTLVTGRNGQGVWEPKVASGFGYTVTASRIFSPPCDKINPSDTCPEGLFSCVSPKAGKCNVRKTQAGIPKLVDIGLTDPVKPNVTKDKPFFIRVGICYTSSSGSKHPAAKDGLFTITRGYRSWGGGGVEPSDLQLRQFWNQLINRVPGQICDGLDAQKPQNLAECPADGVIPVPTEGDCPAPSVRGTGANENDCIFAKSPYSPDSVEDIGKLRSGVSPTNPDGTPVFDKYYYDPVSGMLFFNVVQEFPNPVASSPLGSCSNGATDPACPDSASPHFESYYACPAQGCVDYRVVLNDDGYTPGPSDCGDIYKDGKFVLKEPANENKLAHSGAAGAIVKPDPQVSTQNFDHAVASDPPKCVDTMPGGS